jgi:hypothetical protein
LNDNLPASGFDYRAANLNLGIIVAYDIDLGFEILNGNVNLAATVAYDVDLGFEILNRKFRNLNLMATIILFPIFFINMMPVSGGSLTTGLTDHLVQWLRTHRT